jgi:hypothetical protein
VTFHFSELERIQNRRDDKRDAVRFAHGTARAEVRILRPLRESDARIKTALRGSTALSAVLFALGIAVPPSGLLVPGAGLTLITGGSTLLYERRLRKNHAKQIRRIRERRNETLARHKGALRRAA